MHLDLVRKTWGGPAKDWYYFFIDFDTSMPIDFGWMRFWYDCPHFQIRLGWITIGWSTEKTLPPYEQMTSYYQYYVSRKPKWWRWVMDLEEFQPPSGDSQSANRSGVNQV